MVWWKLKACPRCGGDTFIDRDIDGWYQQCLMCSHRLSLKELDLRKKEPVSVAADKGEDYLS